MHKQEMELQTYACTSFLCCQLFTDPWRGRMSFLSSEIITLFIYFIHSFILSYFILFYFILFYLILIYFGGRPPLGKKTFSVDPFMLPSTYFANFWQDWHLNTFIHIPFLFETPPRDQQDWVYSLETKIKILPSSVPVQSSSVQFELRLSLIISVSPTHPPTRASIFQPLL